MFALAIFFSGCDGYVINSVQNPFYKTPRRLGAQSGFLHCKNLIGSKNQDVVSAVRNTVAASSNDIAAICYRQLNA